MRGSVLLLLCGCAASPTPLELAAEADGQRHAARTGHGTPSGAHLEAVDAPARPRSETLGYEGRFEAKRLGPVATPEPPRPPRIGRRTIVLRRARLDNAFRLLAREGRFDLVLPGELPDPVTVELASVDPYDALRALAEAHGLSVRYRDRIVIVGEPR